MNLGGKVLVLGWGSRSNRDGKGELTRALQQLYEEDTEVETAHRL